MNPELLEVCRTTRVLTQDELNEKMEALEGLQGLFELEFAEEMNSVEVVRDIFSIIAGNLFRELPSRKEDFFCLSVGPRFDKINSTEDPRILELVAVYKLLYSVIRSIKRKPFFGSFVDESFVKKLIGLIKSEDSNERCCVVKVTSRIYRSGFAKLRQIIYENIINQLMDVIAQNSVVHCYVDSLLEVLISIIVHKQTSVSPEMERTLFKLLFSLHKLPYLYYFYQQLFSCCSKLCRIFPNRLIDFNVRVLKCYRLSTVTTMNILDSTKPSLCLVEIEFILKIICERLSEPNDPAVDMQAVMSPLVKVIFECLSNSLKSQNSDLFNHALVVLGNKQFKPILLQHASIMDKTIMPALNDPQTIISWNGKCVVQHAILYMYLDALRRSSACQVSQITISTMDEQRNENTVIHQ